MTKKFVFIFTMLILLAISIVNVTYSIYKEDHIVIADTMLYTSVKSCLDDGYFKVHDNTFMCVYIGKYEN